MYALVYQYNMYALIYQYNILSITLHVVSMVSWSMMIIDVNYVSNLNSLSINQ